MKELWKKNDKTQKQWKGENNNKNKNEKIRFFKSERRKNEKENYKKNIHTH